MKALEAHHDEFEKMNTVVLGISVDTAPSKRAWAREIGVTKTSLPCDFWPHGQVAKLYGLFSEEFGNSERANVLVDENQRIAWIKVYKRNELPDIDEVLAVIKRMSKS